MTERHRHRIRLCSALSGLLFLASPTHARAAWPDPVGAIQAAIDLPLRAVGSAVGGVGLVAAGGIALVGDGVRLVDGNRWTEPWTRGIVSDLVYRGARAFSMTSTGVLEALRREDIERLPEALATYDSAAPFVGRLDTALTGGSAMALAVGDLVCAAPLAILRLVGARETAERLEQSREDARVAALGPSPL